jgi:hypothetical protein
MAENYALLVWGSNMELIRQTRFEQVPLAAALKIGKQEDARLRRIKIAKAILKQNGVKK